MRRLHTLYKYYFQNMLFLQQSTVMQYLNSVCNFTHFVCIFLFLHKPSVLLHSVCCFDIFALLGPINLNLRYFVAKFVFEIYAFFGVNFIIRKFCPCKRNDKYEVCFAFALIYDKALYFYLV